MVELLLREFGRLIKETAAHHFIGYYISGYLAAGRYPVLNFKASIV